ncbi:MAG: hypothetical protein JST93_19725 [Acidobacteria bacterium]|nr:hypothetical protein [Acidobacteriota bacterium]
MNHSRRILSSASSVTSFLRLWLLALAVLAGTPAGGAPLSSPSTSVLCSVEGNTFFLSTLCEFGGGPGVPSSARAEVTLTPVPHVIATATTPKEGFLGAGSSATALYYFQVVGPTDGELVPILMDIYLLSQSTFEAKAIAKLIINTSAGLFEGFEVCSDGTCDETAISQTIDLQVRTGSTRDSITLYAQAQAFVTRSTTETALAVADPHIYIDPSFPNAHLYSIILSPGVGNEPASSDVPEPATMSLVCVALCWVRWMARSRRSGDRELG